jgi:hypothetical protein
MRNGLELSGGFREWDAREKRKLIPANNQRLGCE